MSSIALQLPPHADLATRTGARRFRKQVLPAGELQVGDRTLTLDRAMFRDLVDTFKARAMDTVPFVLADRLNRHSDDPERFRGTVTDVEAADDGLYATIDVSDRGATTLADNPALPVSARLIPPESKPGAGRWVLGHVCGTLNPVAKGLSPWAAVEASSNDTVIDLSEATLVSDQEAEHLLFDLVETDDRRAVAESMVFQFTGESASPRQDREPVELTADNPDDQALRAVAEQMAAGWA